MKTRIHAAHCLVVVACFLLPVLARPADFDIRHGRVVSEIDPLRSVIILSPSTEERREIYYLYGDSPLLLLNYLEGVVQQHKKFSDLLKKSGVRTLNLVDLLGNAISNARKAGKLEGALAEILPEQYPRLREKMDRITASPVTNGESSSTSWGGLFFGSPMNSRNTPLFLMRRPRASTAREGISSSRMRTPSLWASAIAVILRRPGRSLKN